MKKNITNNLIDYDFSSILELLDFIENSQPITYANSSISGSKSFTGTNSFGEAFDMCKNGYFSKDVENFQNLFFKIVNQINKKLKYVRIKHDVVGAAPDVPLYLIGNPLNMINLEKKEHEKRPKKIVFHFNASIPWYTPKSTIENRGLTYVLLFDLLRKLKCPVELKIHSFTNWYEDDKVFYVNTSVPLLKENDMINISKIYFPLVHPSFLRRIIFAVKERIVELRYHQRFFDDYGTSTHIKKYIELSNDIINSNYINIFSDDFKYESIKNALKAIIKQIDNEDGLQTSLESVLELIDSMDFSSLKEFDREDDDREY